jgi:hypothetical protein
MASRPSDYSAHRLQASEDLVWVMLPSVTFCCTASNSVAAVPLAGSGPKGHGAN